MALSFCVHCRCECTAPRQSMAINSQPSTLPDEPAPKIHALTLKQRAAFSSRYDGVEVHFIETRVVITDAGNRERDIRVYMDASHASITSCDLQLCSECAIFDINELEECECTFCIECAVAQLTSMNRDAQPHMGPQGTDKCPACQNQSTTFRQMYDEHLHELLARSLLSTQA